MYPSLREFKRDWSTFERVAVYKEIGGDMDTPVSMLARFLRLERVILLESAGKDKTYSRFSFLAFATDEKIVLRNDGLYREEERVGPLSHLSKLLRPVRTAPSDGFGSFSGGYVGHLAFDFVGECNILERPLAKKSPILGVLHLVETFCVYDNHTNKLYIAISRRTDGSDAEDAYRALAREAERIEDLIASLAPSSPAPFSEPSVVRTIPRGLFIDRVRRTRDMIGQGEAIQIVLSDFIEAEQVDPFEFYRNLRKINPSPYMYFIKEKDSCIVGSSPEIHLQVRGRRATLKPIAGTKPRTARGLSDDVRVLTDDEKERAEHLMLVDLARNDLSRICKVGTVEVKSFMEPEAYSHVVHLVSEVEGVLADGTGPVEALMQTFPAGTVSGAPKVRAIEVIDEMEDHARGPYAGCVGYIGFDGSLDMAITIRTAIFTGTRTRLQAGAGIVFDSVPEREYDEVMHKLLVLMKAGGLA